VAPRHGGGETAPTSEAPACLVHIFLNSSLLVALVLSFTPKRQKGATMKTPQQQPPLAAGTKVKVQPAHQKQKETWFMDMGVRMRSPPWVAAPVHSCVLRGCEPGVRLPTGGRGTLSTPRVGTSCAFVKPVPSRTHPETLAQWRIRPAGGRTPPAG